MAERGGLDIDERFMRQALALARRGRGTTHPNPRVGAVVVRNGEVVGRGSHAAPGLPHAEVVALREAGEAARGATVYCTLEPCAHQGRTPPCSDALIAAGVARVVVGLRDPNPLVNGRGLAQLTAAGISAEIITGKAAAEATELNAPFLKFVRSGLPFVTYKAAVSVDGRMAAAGGDARWITGEESRRLVHGWRSLADAVLIGAGTLRRDDPLLSVRHVRGRTPLRVVLSRTGSLPPDAALFGDTGAGPVLVLCEHCENATREALSARGVEVVEYEGGPAEALRTLSGRGVLDVLFEGGPGLAAELLRLGLVDRLAVFVAPLLIGEGAPSLLALTAPREMSGAVRLAGARWRRVGDDMLLTARIPNDGPDEKTSQLVSSQGPAHAGHDHREA